MKKSEKILLAVLSVVLLWAGYILLLEDKPKEAGPAVAPESYETVVAGLRTGLEKSLLTDLERYKISLAGQELGSGPFYSSANQFYLAGSNAEGGPDGEGLVYSGYLQAGNRSYAIINGIEYAVGDEIAVGGYRLSQISQGYVVLERRDSSSGRVFKRQLPLTDDQVEDVTLKAVY
ncbi:MAG: hypothetical protein AB7E32_02985 [Desulfovibrio sp.]